MSSSSTATKATPTPLKDVTLPTSIFNKSLYTSILDYWFRGMTDFNQTQPSPELAARWFGIGPLSSPEQTKIFDEECQQIGGSALAFLSPDNISLPSFSPVPAEAVKEECEAVGDLIRPFTSLPIFSSSSNETSRAEKAEAALALIILIDQFGRNTCRGHQKVIYTHYDVIARSLVHAITLSPPKGAEDTAGILHNLHLEPTVASGMLKYSFLLMPLMHSEAIADHDTYAAVKRELDIARDPEMDKQESNAADDFEMKHRVLLERFGRYPHRNEHLQRIPTEEETKFLTEGGDRFGT